MSTDSGAVYDLIAYIAKHTSHTAWVGHHGGINSTLHSALYLAFTARLPWQVDEFARIVGAFNGGHWLGADDEEWYRIACREGAHPSAAPAVEHWLRREPFLLDGERVYVGRRIAWEGSLYRCTSIEADFVRAKQEGFRDGVKLPETLITIPRAGFEARLAAQKDAAKAERAAAREAERADPVELRPLREHLEREAVARNRWGNAYQDPRIPAAFEAFGTDYERAYREIDDLWAFGAWMERLGIVADCRANSADEIRKRYSWPRVLQAIYRTVRKARGLPLKESP